MASIFKPAGKSKSAPAFTASLQSEPNLQGKEVCGG
jgi:hypothetical protein